MSRHEARPRNVESDLKGIERPGMVMLWWGSYGSDGYAFNVGVGGLFTLNLTHCPYATYLLYVLILSIGVS